MKLNVAKEVAALNRLTTNDLRARYAEVFGEATHANNKPWLVKRIAWRLQAQADGDLTERARQRARELANDADLRLSPPRPKATLPIAERTQTMPLPAKAGVPVPGTVITRVYEGETLQVKVLADGFEFEGEVHPSLSAVAKRITGSHTSGFLFFRLNGGQR